MPLCLVLWLLSTKPASPAALCRATSDSWITSHASVTTSSQCISAQATLVRSHCTAHCTLDFVGFSCLWSTWKFYISKQHTKQLTSSAFSASHTFVSFLLFVSALFSGAKWPNMVLVPLTLGCLLLLLWVSSYLHLSPGPPPPVQETMDANLQKLTQLVNKESNLIEKVLLLSLFSSLHGFMIAFERYNLSCT